MKNGFDKIAFAYDLLADIFFFGRIFKAQTYFIGTTYFSGNILVLGGGTGRILLPLLKNCTKAHVFYLDASGEMIRRSKRITNDPTVIFIHGTEADLPVNITFDYIIAPFFFDLFREPELSDLICKLKQLSNKGAHWLVTDFVNDKWWHRVATGAMYQFFRWVCGVTPSRLESWEHCLSKEALIPEQSKSFYFGFIKARVYKV